MNAGRKRKIADYQASNTNASSTLPTEKNDRENLAWIVCVLQMATRQLALLNKTGQVDFEVNVVCRSFIEWIRNIVQQHFQAFFGATLFLSYDRAIAGYVSRQVATTFMATCARHYSECDSMTDANTMALLDMETAPLTLMSANLAVSNGLMHLVDTNLLMVNQIIRDKLNTPVLSTDFLVSLFDEACEINMSGGPFEEIFGWVSQAVQCRDGSEFSMGYVVVPKLGSPEDYNAKESYLESYYGIAKGHYFTYNMAVRECSSKTFDLSGFLNMEASMLDYCRFLSRLGVSFEGLAPPAANSPFIDQHRSTYIYIQSANSGGPDGGNQNANNAAAPQPNAAPPAPAAPRSAGIGKCWASMIQHLLVTSIQGRSELHADNQFSFGANITEFILSRCAPLQSAPAQQMVGESFRHVNDDVLPLRTPISSKRPEYFVRTINDHGALDYGFATELPAMLGPHPVEDVMHLGSWIQLYSILNAGAKPSKFECFPNYNGRPPELVCGRVYPLVHLENGKHGTLCLAPDGRSGSFRMITTTLLASGVYESQVHSLMDIKDWFKFVISESGFMVAPLVFRRHAIFQNVDNRAGNPLVAINFQTPEYPDTGPNAMFPRHEGAPAVRQFLSSSGHYTLGRCRGQHSLVHFTEAHERLVPLGAFVLIRAGAVSHFGLGASKDWIRGSLRYPDDIEPDSDDHQFHVYVAIRVRTRNNEAFVRVVHVHVEDSFIMEDSVLPSSEICFEAFTSGVNGAQQ